MSNLGIIGKNIVLLREAQGISREAAALNVSMSVSRWQDIEHGCSNTTIETLRRMAEVLGVAPLVFGVLSRTDEEILSEVHRLPGLPEQPPKEVRLGDNLISLRKAAGLSQRRFARRANVSAARLRDLEHNCANVTIETLERIAGALDVPLLTLGALTLPEKEILKMVHDAQRILEERTVMQH